MTDLGNRDDMRSDGLSVPSLSPEPGRGQDAGSPRSVLSVEGVQKVYGNSRGGRKGRGTTTQAIADLTFEQHEGEFLVIVGPSGCGKSTLLRCLSGLLMPTSGTVSYLGEQVTDVPESLAVVFQEYGRSLFPWMRVDENVAVGLERLPVPERQARIAEALEHVDLADSSAHYPWQLSGGMQQRTAIARAIASRPQLLLMDEPFASVDAQSRASLEEITLNLWEEYGWTVLLVTHDIDEAVFMGDRVLVLSRRPSSIIDDIKIDLPRPRDQLDTRALPEFAEYRRRIVNHIRGQHADAGPKDA